MFDILLSLSGAEMHGYGILRDIARRSDDEPDAATLYRSLRKLLELDLISELDERPAPELDDQRRRYYRITELGERAARAEAGRLARLVAAADRQGLLSRPTEGI